jgi:hypothetical protein
MSKVINRSLPLATVLVAFLISGPAAAEPVNPYADPIPLGDHVDDVGAMLAAAFEGTPWTLVRENDALYLGKLSNKGVDVQVRISILDNVLTFTLDSVTETGCSGECKDLGEKRVLNWLISLRRKIAYELTLLVRDSLEQQIS